MENTIRRFLVVIEGPNEGQAYPLQDMVSTIGRTADNTIVIDSTRISRHHTQIRLAEGTTGTTAIVEDMGSTNGTWVNHRQLTGPHQLMPGDVVTLADYITFRYEVEDALSTAKLAPTMPGSATQMMDDSTPYPPPPDYEEPYRAYPKSSATPPNQPFIQFGSAQQTPPPSQPPSVPQQARTAPPTPPPAAAPPAKRSKWIYVIVAILLVLICICLGIAIYLWFAPVTFWESVFELFNIPLP